jgi:hypothetical protein
LPKVTDEDDKTAGYTPFSLNCAVWGEAEELSFTFSVPVLAPRTVGVQVTEILQLAPAASVFGAIGHFEACPKFPETEMLLIVKGTVRVLLRVTVFAVLVVCRTQFPKATVVGLNV